MTILSAWWMRTVRTFQVEMESTTGVSSTCATLGTMPAWEVPSHSARGGSTVGRERTASGTKIGGMSFPGSALTKVRCLAALTTLTVPLT